MKSTCTTCFTLLFLFALSLPCLGQGNTPCCSPAKTTPLGVTVPPGSYVPGELIVRFPISQNSLEKKKFEDEVEEAGGLVAEWSPSSIYARVTELDFTTCGIISGNGNPLGDQDGQGQEIDFNYIASTQSWTSSPLYSPTCEAPGDSEGTIEDNYSPTSKCSEEAQLVPPTGQHNVKIAIIDSGVKHASENEIVNTVSLQQTIIPGTCVGGGCQPIRENIQELSSAFNNHGRFIYKIISGWFRAKGLADQLSVHSYQVLNDELQCTVFQVIKAIELAAMEEVQVINLSVGFQLAECVIKDPAPKTGNTTPYRSLLYYVIKEVEKAGVIVINSAGNSCADLAATPQYPAADTDLPNLVVVGALNCESSGIACWSNYSDQHVDLFVLGEKVRIVEYGCHYRELYGTSFAAPIVTAKAAFHITNLEDYNPGGVLCPLKAQADALEGAIAIHGSVNALTNNGLCNNLINDEVENFEQPDVQAMELFRVAPNPFQNQLILSPAGDPINFQGTVTLLDSHGRTVLKNDLKGTQLKLELANLTPGVYFLHLLTKEGQSVRRVIKQ